MVKQQEEAASNRAEFFSYFAFYLGQSKLELVSLAGDHTSFHLSVLKGCLVLPTVVL